MTQKRPKVERLQGIVQAAVAEFLEKGYEAASMEAIARRANLSKGGLYHHFQGKDEILHYANQFLSQPLQGYMHHALSRSSPRQGLIWFIRRYLKFWKERPNEIVFLFLSMTKVFANRNLWDMYENMTEQTIGFYQQLLDKGIASGEFRQHDTRERAVLLMSVLDGVIGYLMLDRHLQEKSVADSMRRLFIDAIDVNKSKAFSRRQDES